MVVLSQKLGCIKFAVLSCLSRVMVRAYGVYTLVFSSLGEARSMGLCFDIGMTMEVFPRKGRDLLVLFLHD